MSNHTKETHPFLEGGGWSSIDDYMNDLWQYPNTPNNCPRCDSKRIEGGGFDAEAGVAWQHIECNDCHYKWCDIYQLQGYEAGN